MRLDLRRNQRKQFCFCSKSCPADVSWRLSESDLFCLLFNQSQMLLLAPELRLGPRVIMNVLFILSLSSSGFLSTVKILSSLQLLLSAVYFQATVFFPLLYTAQLLSVYFPATVLCLLSNPTGLNWILWQRTICLMYFVCVFWQSPFVTVSPHSPAAPGRGSSVVDNFWLYFKRIILYDKSILLHAKL